MFRRDHNLVEICRFGSTVTKPPSVPSTSASTIRAAGTSSVRQRSRHQATRESSRYARSASARRGATDRWPHLRRRGNRAVTCRFSGSPFSQLELDAAIARRRPRSRRIDRLEFAEARGDQPLRRYAFADEILHHRDRARRRQIPVRLELATGGDRRTSVWPSTRSTQECRPGFAFPARAARPPPFRVRCGLQASGRLCRCRRTPPIAAQSGRRRCACHGRLPRISRSLPKKSER